MKEIYENALKYFNEFRQKIPEDKRYSILIGCGICSFVFLLFNNGSEERVILKTQQSIDYKKGRILNNSRNIYKRKEKVLSNDMKELQRHYKISTQELRKQIKTLKSELEKIKENNQQKHKKVDETELPLDSSFKSSELKTEVVGKSQKTSSSQKETDRRRDYQNQRYSRKYSKGPTIISFPVKEKERKIDQVVLPAGSFLKAKLLVGIQASESKPVPSLLLAEEAFIGPNKTRVDLTGCFLIAKSSGNLSIERVEMQATKISCVSKSGKMFERKMNGFVADKEDGSFALKGELKSRQGRVAALGFLSAIVEGVGNAIQQAQTTQSTNAVGGTNSSITGDQGKYLLAGGASNAASRITDWYLKQAEGLLPHIEIKASQNLYVIIQDSVNLPNWYFKQNKKGKPYDYSYLSTILD